MLLSTSPGGEWSIGRINLILSPFVPRDSMSLQMQSRKPCLEERIPLQNKELAFRAELDGSCSRQASSHPQKSRLQVVAVEPLSHWLQDVLLEY